MTTELETGLYIFILAGFLGYHVISRVHPLLHTPLMSATNAMSGISLVGSLVVAGADHSALSNLFGFIAVVCSSTNVVGGFLITDRMLKMFKKGAPAVPPSAAGGPSPASSRPDGEVGKSGRQLRVGPGLLSLALLFGG